MFATRGSRPRSVPTSGSSDFGLRSPVPGHQRTRQHRGFTFVEMLIGQQSRLGRYRHWAPQYLRKCLKKKVKPTDAVRDAEGVAEEDRELEKDALNNKHLSDHYR